MNKKSVILLSILVLAFLFLNTSDAFSQQKNNGLPEEISGGMGVENKNEGVPVLKITEKKSSENIGAENQSDSLGQGQENKGIVLQKNMEGDKKEYNDKIRRLELLNIAIIVLFLMSLIFNMYIFIKIRNNTVK